MHELINHICELAEKFRTNATAQAEHGNKAAGLRARRSTLEMEPLLKQFRKLSLEQSRK